MLFVSNKVVYIESRPNPTNTRNSPGIYIQEDSGVWLFGSRLQYSHGIFLLVQHNVLFDCYVSVMVL